MTDRQLRALRGASASTVATVLAAVSHTVGGGAAPAPLLVVAMAAVLALPAILVVGRRPRLSRVLAAVVTTQAAFHLAFLALGSPVATRISASAHAGHLHAEAHAHPALVETAVLATAADAPMLAAHAVAALVTTALLWRGEQLVRAIAAWAIARLVRAAALPLVRIRRRLPLRADRRGERASRRFHDIRLQRGPPSASFA
ncbi:hypothetical protein [Microbacterium sp. JZ37]|uniref:hypothetical protein n=1 Tax=Microbacterium sp. JZ37 TaxID=2654193 RepID=UPI002B47C608|nr:hypothetical protein [Microbacterium sp. JZ37]WRH18047.1 hypothetical protein GC092_11360 [Microbacterium sp. JZ37]